MTETVCSPLAVEKDCSFRTLDVYGYKGDHGVNRTFVNVASLNSDSAKMTVWIRGRVDNIRKQSAKLCFLTIRQSSSTVQVVCFSKDACMFCSAIPRESVVEIYGTVSQLKVPVHSTTQKDVEIQIEKLFVFSLSETGPVQVVDLERTSIVDGPTVNLESRLANRVLDLRTRASRGIFRIQSMCGKLFREFLESKGFIEIHTPKLIGIASEGGSDVFKLDYFGTTAYLAQSPQLYKQMALMGDLERVFEIGPVFRAEQSFTHRHMTEYTSMDIEMVIQHDYHEVLETLMGTFNFIFEGIKKYCSSEIDLTRSYFEADDLIWDLDNHKSRITFVEAISLLKEKGPEIIAKDMEIEGNETLITDLQQRLTCLRDKSELEDLTTPEEKLLGRIMHQEYGIQFYAVDKFPLAVRPFYTMPDKDNNLLSNAFDIYIRGEEVLSGGQRIHCPELLIEKCNGKGVSPESINHYINSFRYGAYPHGGGAIGLERLVMLYLGIPNIRYVSMFPRDPKRISP